jgi:hypothetical protein
MATKFFDKPGVELKAIGDLLTVTFSNGDRLEITNSGFALYDSLGEGFLVDASLWDDRDKTREVSVRALAGTIVRNSGGGEHSTTVTRYIFPKNT